MSLIILVPLGISAHHGSAPYDRSRSTTVRGTVTQFRFMNPHVLIYAAVEGLEGEVVEWSGELTSPNRLARGESSAKWNRNIIQPGDIIELTGNPALNGAPSLRLLKVVNADGAILVGDGRTETPSSITSEELATETPPNVILKHGDDLAGVWMRDIRGPEGAPYQNYAFSAEPPPMTEWGRRRYETAKPTFGTNSVAVSETNDSVYQCLPPGTPRIYFHPRPLEIIQMPGRVMIVYEYQQLIRQIYTDGRSHRTDLAPSWMGDSIGHWEDKTLVVETVNFNDKTWIDRRGLPHSDRLRVLEKIRIANDNRLEVEITVQDPIAFQESWSAKKFFSSVDWTIEEFVCLDNSSFGDFEQILLDHEPQQQAE